MYKKAEIHIRMTYLESFEWKIEDFTEVKDEKDDLIIKKSPYFKASPGETSLPSLETFYCMVTLNFNIMYFVY